MRKNKNKVHLEGFLYEHNLEVKVSGPTSKVPNTTFISGTISIATDDECVNIVPVHFTYVTATTSKGGPNATFNTLKNIHDGIFGSVMGVGKENAIKLVVDSALALNEFYAERNGVEELVSSKRAEGGFVHKVDVVSEDPSLRNYFEVDMVITNAVRKEADEEKDLPEKMILKGAIFDFRNALLPVEFTVLSPKAMDYFENAEISSKNPFYLELKGKQVSETIVKKIVEENAFGEPFVKETTSSRKDFVIFHGGNNIYEWDDENTMTVADMNKAIADREVYLATMKQRQDEYKASKQQAKAAAAPQPTIANNGFNF